jgi:hypothetical protein
MKKSVKMVVKEIIEKRRLSIYDQKDLEKLVDEVDGKLRVNWEIYDKMTERREYDTAVCALLELGILSFREKGNYGLIGGGTVLNPSTVGSSIYFTQKEDALAYKKAQYSGAIYRISLFQVIE